MKPNQIVIDTLNDTIDMMQRAYAKLQEAAKELPEIKAVRFRKIGGVTLKMVYRFSGTINEIDGYVEKVDGVMTDHHTFNLNGVMYLASHRVTLAKMFDNWSMMVKHLSRPYDVKSNKYPDATDAARKYVRGMHLEDMDSVVAELVPQYSNHLDRERILNMQRLLIRQLDDARSIVRECNNG